VSDADQTEVFSLQGGDRPPGHPWAHDDFAAPDESFADYPWVGLTNLGFIRAALRRGARLWCALAVAGLLIGVGAVVKFPAPYQASTSLLLANTPGSSPGTTILNDQAIAQSRTVAGTVIRQLGLRENAAALLSKYTTTVESNQVLLIAVKASSSQAAVREANALARALLTFQADMLNHQQQLINTSLEQLITQSQQNISSMDAQISQLSAQHVSTAQQTKIASLKSDRAQATNALVVLKQTTATTEASDQAANAAVVKDSQVLDVGAPIKQSRKKRLLLFVGGGLLAGLVLGIGIVVLGAIVSDRVRRRDDIARILRAPVKLSVGRVRLSRWRTGRRGLAAAEDRNIRRIVAYLDSLVPAASDAPASLAIVPVDDLQIPAICVVSLAVSLAQQGVRVILADLCTGAPAARLLGAAEPGIRTVTAEDTQLAVAIPDPDDAVPAGPMQRGRRGASANDVAAAARSADLLLTMVALDPALGADHLRGWATGAVVMVTAGQSSAARIHGVGEMISLAGTQLISAVLIGADKSDESLGVTHTPATNDDARAMQADLPRAGEFFVTVDRGPPDG
jgi:capsular polysaccharide biosynthesis protein